jgi:hypothetical protein
VRVYGAPTRWLAALQVRNGENATALHDEKGAPVGSMSDFDVPALAGMYTCTGDSFLSERAMLPPTGVEIHGGSPGCSLTPTVPKRISTAVPPGARVMGAGLRGIANDGIAGALGVP